MISFKLETDIGILSDKIEKSFKEHDSDLIVGNILQYRNDWVTISTQESTVEVKKPASEDQTLEDALIEKLVTML